MQQQVNNEKDGEGKMERQGDKHLNRFTKTTPKQLVVSLLINNCVNTLQVCN